MRLNMYPRYVTSFEYYLFVRCCSYVCPKCYESNYLLLSLTEQEILFYSPIILDDTLYHVYNRFYPNASRKHACIILTPLNPTFM